MPEPASMPTPELLTPSGSPIPVQERTLAASVAPVRLREPESDEGLQPPTSSLAPVARLGRYHILGEIAHGGMGAVFKVEDPDLGRKLALKVLLARHQERPDLLRRFLEEAQVGGQLQHPGIVPVHELGQSQDGRPFFTMKLVKGDTLADQFKQRQSHSEDLPRFLTIFEQVCLTVAYAHSRGVIHRDLKPANIMVGAFAATSCTHAQREHATSNS